MDHHKVLIGTENIVILIEKVAARIFRKGGQQFSP